MDDIKLEIIGFPCDSNIRKMFTFYVHLLLENMFTFTRMARQGDGRRGQIKLQRKPLRNLLWSVSQSVKDGDSVLATEPTC